jgi:hypothetical protein
MGNSATVNDGVCVVELNISYCRVAERAFCNGLEEGRFTNVGKPNLKECEYIIHSSLRSSLPTYDAALQAVARPAKKNLLLLCFFLWRHPSLSFGVESNELREW